MLLLTTSEGLPFSDKGAIIVLDGEAPRGKLRGEGSADSTAVRVGEGGEDGDD